MKIYFSNTYSDEDGTAEEAKSGMIYASKEELLKICEFFEKVKIHISDNDICHMQLRDNYTGWKKDESFDIEVNLDEN